jgi:hypothetical protein
MRRIDDLANGTTRALERAQRLRLRGYDQEELGEVVRDAAALWERSLKASDPTWSSWTLNRITEQLDSDGWTEGSTALHLVRRQANQDKHEPQPDHRIGDIIAALQVVESQLDTLLCQVPGLGATVPGRERIRHMVCAVYELFAHGETEYVFLEAGPMDTWQSARTIDRFQIQNRNASEVELALGCLTGWVRNPPTLADLHASLLQSDNELWMIATFEASYQQVYDIMAGYQHALPLLPGLHREDSYGNLVASVAHGVLSGTQAAVTGRSILDTDGMRAKIEGLLALVPARLMPLRLDRCDPAQFEAALSSAVAVDRDLRALVTARGLLLVEAR